MSRRVEELILRLRRLGNNRFLPGASEEQIGTFESRTGVKLPEQFKEWLLVTDGGDLIMPGGKNDYRRILSGLRSGILSRAQLEINASRVWRLARRLAL